jgi:alkylhydroperoxidase family enzyme
MILSTESKLNTGAGESLSAKDKRQADERETYVLGDGPRLEPLPLNEISSGLIAILKQMENVNDVLNSNAEGDRGGTMELRKQVLADPEAAAKSPEILARLPELPEIVGTMLRHPDLLVPHTEVGLQLLRKGTLSFHDREFAVLRIAWHCQAPYEWGEHVRVGKRIGLTSEDIARVINGPDSEGLTEHEQAILRAVDELYNDAMITDDTWNTLAKQLDEKQLIELLIVVGHYHSMAYYQNSLRLRLHTGNAGLKAR